MSNVVPSGRGVAQTKFRPILIADRVAFPAINSTQTPPAIYDPESNRTFISHLGPNRGYYITEIDHSNNVTYPSVFIGDTAIGIWDSHNCPTVAIDKQGYVHLVVAEHQTALRWARSTQPRTVQSGFGTLANAGGVPVGTYVSVALEPQTGDLFAFYRSGGGHGTGYPKHEYGTLARLPAGATAASQWVDEQPATGAIDLTAALGTTIDGQAFGSFADVYFPAISAMGNDKMALSWNVAHGDAHDGKRDRAFAALYKPSTKTFTNVAAVPTQLGAFINWSSAYNSCRIINDFASTGTGAHQITNGVWSRADSDGTMLVLAGLRLNSTTAVLAVRHFNGNAWVSGNLNVGGVNVTNQSMWLGSSGSSTGAEGPATLMMASARRNGDQYEIYVNHDGKIEAFTLPVGQGSLSFSKIKTITEARFMRGLYGAVFAMSVDGDGPIRSIWQTASDELAISTAHEIWGITKDSIEGLIPARSLELPVQPFALTQAFHNASTVNLAKLDGTADTSGGGTPQPVVDDWGVVSVKPRNNPAFPGLERLSAVKLRVRLVTSIPPYSAGVSVDPTNRYRILFREHYPLSQTASNVGVKPLQNQPNTGAAVSAFIREDAELWMDSNGEIYGIVTVPVRQGLFDYTIWEEGVTPPGNALPSGARLSLHMLALITS